MKIDFSESITDFDGQVVMEGNEREGMRPITLAVICSRALLNEQVSDTDTKLRRYKLAQKIHTGGLVSISHEEAVEIRAAIAGAYGTFITGFVFAVFDAIGEDNE